MVIQYNKKLSVNFYQTFNHEKITIVKFTI